MRSRIAKSRIANRKFQYCTIGATFVLLVILSFLSYRLYVDTKLETEQRSNRRQLLLVEQAGERVSSFLEALTASLRHSAGFLRTIEPEHPGRVAAMMALYERLGGRGRVSELGYLQSGDEQNATIPKEYIDKLANCSWPPGACLLVIRDRDKRVSSLFAAVPVKLQGVVTEGEENRKKSDWLYARISLAELARTFIEPMQSEGRERAWLVDGGGRIVFSPGIAWLEGVQLSTLARELKDARLEKLAERMKSEEKGFDWHLNLEPEKKEKHLRYLTAFSRFQVGHENWVFALTTPSAEVVGLLGNLFQKGLLLTGFGFVALILAALLILDRDRRRIRAEDRIHWSVQVLESNRRLETLFNGITDAICILDEGFRICMLNQSMGRLFGWETSDLLAQKWEISPETAVPEAFVAPSVVAGTFATGEPGFFEKSILREDGRRMDMEYYTYPILAASGDTLQVILYLKDVTERKVLEKEVLQQDRLSIVGKMSEQVAHSIRNPLSAINLSAELLGDELSQFTGADTSEAWALLKSVRAEVDIMRQVTADYLKFVRMPSLEKTPVDCNEMLEDLLDLYTEVAAGRNIQIEQDFTRDIPEVALDEAQIRVAIQNLIMNGFDAMPDGGRLLVKTELADQHLVIRISDSGVGISPEGQASLFTPFFTTKANGTGLGLVLSRQIITEHGGGIRLESTEGTGATFIVELPLAVAQEAKV